jgi:hypothetical protein
MLHNGVGILTNDAGLISSEGYLPLLVFSATEDLAKSSSAHTFASPTSTPPSHPLYPNHHRPHRNNGSRTNRNPRQD